MRSLLVLLGLMLAVPVLAQRPPARRPANAPHLIGKFDDWQAATHVEGDQTVCYAFTRAASSNPALPGRGEVVLTVSQRTTPRDVVAMSAGFGFPAGAEVQVQADQAALVFYTDKRNAFARDGHAAVAAFGRARQAVMKSPGPRQAAIVDTFSLHGFNAAYAAMTRACPVKS